MGGRARPDRGFALEAGVAPPTKRRSRAVGILVVLLLWFPSIAYTVKTIGSIWISVYCYCCCLLAGSIETPSHRAIS
jgi:hypothetical protein